ncbi:hypothetical protein ABPG72_019429 [Tetrahymena utriculariae]
MSSFERLSVLEQQRIKLEEAQMKKKVIEEKKKKESEAKAKEEKIKQQQESKLQKQSSLGQQSSAINLNVKESTKKSSLPPTGQSSSQKRPNSALKPSDQGNVKQTKEIAQKKQTGPIQMLKKIISLEDIEEQRAEIEPELEKYQQEKPKEIKNAYNNVVVKEYQKEQINVKDQYLMQLQIQEQMKKIQKTQELKYQQAKQKNMLMKQQVIEEMLNQTNQDQKQNQSSNKNTFTDYKDSCNSQNSHDKQYCYRQEDQNDIEKDDLNDTLDYNQNKRNNNSQQSNYQERQSQNFKAEKKGLKNQQQDKQNENNSKSSLSQMYPVDSLNQLPPLKSQVQTNNTMIDKNNNSQRETSNRVQMVQSQNYVGEEEITNNYSKQNRESVLSNKASANNGISDSIQIQKVETQKKSSQIIGQAKMYDSTQKSNMSSNYQSKVNNKMQNNPIQKSEFENNFGKNSKQFDKADAQSKVSQLNKSIRDQIFQDEIDYTESLQVDVQYPFLEKQSKSHQKNSQNKSFSVQESQERASKVQNKDKQKQSSFLKQKIKKYSSSPCIQQEDFDESDQGEPNQQKNTSNFNYQNINNSKFSNESQNLNKNLSAASNGQQRSIKSSAQNERFPIFNKGSQLQTDQNDSETECKKQSLKNVSDKQNSSKNQSGSETEEIFENECKEDQGDNMPPTVDKIFQTFKSNPIQLEGNFYNSNYNNQDSNQEEEQIQNQGEEDEDFDSNQENQFEQTEFEDIGNNYAVPQKSMNGVKDSLVKGMKYEDCNDNQLKQLSDYSDAQNQSDEDKEELQDEASLRTKLQGSKQKNEEPMVVSFGVQNQQSFGKQSNLNESQKQRQNIQKNSYEEDSLNENFQTFGARDSDKFLGIAINHTKQQKSVELRKSQKPSQDFNETQKLPYCDQTAQFNEEVNPFKQLKQQMRQVKQTQQINKQDIQKNQEFDRKRSDILRDAENNIKKVMNDQIRMADSNKFKFSEQEESESPLNNQSYKSGISQNKSAQSRAQLLDNMRKKKDTKQQVNSNSQSYNQDRLPNQYPSRPQFITQSNISQLKNNNQTFNNNNSSDKMSTPDQQSYLKNSFDLKFQEAYEQQYDQSCNSQMVEGSPIQFVKNQNDIYQKYPNVNNQERDYIIKKSQQADSKSIIVVHKPNCDEEDEEDFWQKQKQAENKKRKVWGNSKPAQQNQDKQYQHNLSDKLSQSIGQTSNVMSNQSNYHSKLQKLHESEEFQDNEFIELTLKQKIQDQNLQNSYEQADSHRNEQPKLWATRNINAGSNRRGNKGYSQNGNQLEMEREEEDQEDYDQNQGQSQNYNNQYRNDYQDEEDYEQEDQNDESYSQNYQNNNYDQQQYYGQEYDDQEYDQNSNNYNDNYQQENEEKSYNKYQNKSKGSYNQRNTNNYQRYHHQEEENDGESDKNDNYTNQDSNTQLNDDDKSDNISPQKQDRSLNDSNEENNLNQNNKSSRQEDEEEEEQQKQIQKGVAMTIDFCDKDDDELEKKKKAFEMKRLKKIQELELQKQKKQQEIQHKQLQQVDDQQSGQKEKKYAHKKQPSQQIQQNQKAQQDNQAISENNTPSNKQVAKKVNEQQNQLAKNQQNFFSVNQREQIINQKNQNSPKSKSPIRLQQVKEKGKLPAINKKKDNIEEENKSEVQENFTPKISVLENPTTKPRIPFSKPSNKQLISQAITKVCLAGPTNSKERETALKKIKDSQQEHFIVLFKGINGRQDFKALYSMDSNTSEVKKIFGLNTAPTQIDLASVQAFYRYDSGSKEFKEILVKAFSNQVDAVLLKK